MDVNINKIKIKDNRYFLQDSRIEDIDQAIIEDSENPVASKAVHEAISELEEDINAVSGLVDTAKEELQNDINVINNKIPEGTSSSNKLVNNNQLSNSLENKVDKVIGKQLSTEDYTTAEKNKLQAINASAQENVIETISVNGINVVPENKNVDITVPVGLAELSSDSTHRTVTDSEKSTWNAKQNALSFDNTPIANSNNPVKSSGIKSAIDAEASARIAGDALKQDVISDLSDIRAGAALGATAIQQHQDISGKQDVINDLSTIRSGAAAGSTAYQKPSAGIPSSDLSAGVNASLGRADSALQQHQDISGKAEKAELQVINGSGINTDKVTIVLKSGTSATVLKEHQDISGKANSADLSTVATSGNYSDLNNKPTIPDFSLEDDTLIINV